MIYLRKNNSKNKYFFNVFGISSILLILAIFIEVVFPKLGLSLVERVAVPIWQSESMVVSLFKNSLSGIFNANDLALEVDRLLAKEDEYKSLSLKIETLEIENKNLKELIALKPQDKNILIGNVIQSPPITPYDILALDVGSSDGVKAGSLAYYLDFVPIGEVIEVFRDTSRVRLYSSPGNQTSVRIGSSTELFNAGGLGNGNFNILIPYGIDVLPKETVYAGSSEEKILGQIIEIGQRSSEAVSEVFFRYPFNLNRLNKVIIEI